MRIAIAADHAGFNHKQLLASWLTEQGHEVVDHGPDSTDRVDYPDFAARVARAVQSGAAQRGVLVCGSGIGMAITANRYQGVRAVVLRIPEDAALSREHNNSNVACLGERITDMAHCQQLLTTWLDTAFAEGRHVGRIEKIDQQGECA